MKNIKELLRPYSVLYAEDDKAVQKSTVDYLNRYFRTVYIANNGKEALNLYKNMQPNILFLDIDIPYMDGLSVAQEVRQFDKDIPIVMLTAYTDTDKLLRATELKLCKYLVKPIDPLEFKSTLRKLSEYFQKSSSLIYLKDSYTWNETTHELSQYNQPITLTQKEQSLLFLLISKRNQCVTFIDIQAYVWEDSFNEEISIQSVKLQVTLLRKKLPKDSIRNVYGKGYILYI